MQIARTIAEFRALRRGARPPLGFVPTMGYLHAGHRALIERARSECAAVAVSIFVNPMQFGPNEDFERYPRDEPGDLALCEAAGADLILIPPLHEMYPAGTSTAVRVGGLTGVLEGAHRPGHFDGVATIVTKLFNVVTPDRSYFGRKDAQQLRVIRRLVRDLDLPVEIVDCATVREPDGLALSSRNVYLSPEERAQALSLSRGLRRAEEAFVAGERDAEALRRLVRDEIEAQPLARIDYVSLADSESLAELEGRVGGPALLSLAVRFGGTRLIDNVVLEPPAAG
ncbi:MAG: pantoate--beta-alanine ligase [Chloroflexi bacterium]|nr:pantoate--beta-alanine ligase [Chloroflexota bacterium]